MDERTLRLLEFDKILDQLSAHATFGPGRARARGLRPSSNPIWVEEGLAETQEAVELSRAGKTIAFGGLDDIRPALEQVAKGRVLDPPALLSIARTVESGIRIKSALIEHAPAEGHLRLTAEGILNDKDAAARIVECIDDDGRVRDRASPKLGDVRRRIRTCQARLRERLEALIHASGLQEALQERIVTVRDGRYVVPVKQAHKRAVPGVVHGQSASGATLFIEPFVAVEHGNELRALQSAESEEIHRILRSLTEQVAQRALELQRSLEALAHLDLVFAKARLAEGWEAVAPEMGRDRPVHIVQGRHPLLSNDAVPIDVELGGDRRALVITGPNTGGKTVALKTVGLFALLAQAGLHVPAEEGTQLPLFDAVFADIGDEQSVEQSLSTFSAHMAAVRIILSRAGQGSLVLLDELGAGTDPAEGAALAMATLEHLLQAGGLVVATTHHEALKAFASDHPHAENASVTFDEETLRPTYALVTGRPGSSHALRIARRLGLPETMLVRAEELLAPEVRRMEALLTGAEEDRRAARLDREAVAQLKRAWAQSESAVRRLLDRLRDKRVQLLAAAKAEAEGIVTDARREVDRLVGQMRKAGIDEVEPVANRVRRGLRELSAAHATTEDRKRTTASAVGSPPAVGDSVRLRRTGQVGVVAEVRNDQIFVRVGAMRVALPAGEVERAPQGGQSQPNVPAFSGSVSALARQKAGQISPEVHLRGMRVDEAMARLEKHFDDAVLAGLDSLRIVHGKGTGTLRRAVEEWLRHHPQVRAFRLGEQAEGGAGVTVADLG